MTGRLTRINLIKTSANVEVFGPLSARRGVGVRPQPEIKNELRDSKKLINQMQNIK
jgi:hypothetical protein